MRIAAMLLLATLVGCNSAMTAPREYLDERTAATITVVRDPWIFTREANASSPQARQRDFLHLYAIDVNRMGEHRQYFAVQQALPPEHRQPPVLELSAGTQTTMLHAADVAAEDLGIAQPIAQSYTLSAAWWYYPVDKRLLAKLANARDLQAALVFDERLAYVPWRDGREELAELTAILP